MVLPFSPRYPGPGYPRAGSGIMADLRGRLSIAERVSGR